MKCHAWGKIVCMELLVVCITTKLVLGRNAERKYAISGSVFRAAYFMLRGANMDNTDKLYECADSYASLTDYEYRLSLYSNGTIVNTTVNFDISSFMHLCGLEKLNDLPLIERNPNSRVIHELIMNSSLSHEYVSNSVTWSVPLNNPQTNNVTYTIKDRIETLTNFRDILNNCSVKAYSWNPDCHSSYRPYSSEIKADFMLVFESDNPKTSDERVYAFFKLDKNNPNIAHGISQFPTDRTYNDDGRRSVPEIKIISLIEHNKVNNVDRVIFELSPDERQRLFEKSLKNSEYATIKLDLKQLKSKRAKYLEADTPTAKAAYEKRLAIFCNKNIYSADMLKSVAERLAAQEQDPNNKQAKDLISKELDYIRTEISNRERTHNSELSSGITLTKSVFHKDGTVSMTEPIATLKVPPVLIKSKSAIKRAAHLVAVSVADIVSNIKNSFSKPNKRAPEKKPIKHKNKPLQTIKSVQEEKQEHGIPKDEPLFSRSKIMSNEFASVSGRDTAVDKDRKNDLDL